MKLSKQATKLFAEYQRAKDSNERPSYLSSERIDDTYGTVRRLSPILDEIYCQVIDAIVHPALYENIRHYQSVCVLLLSFICTVLANVKPTDEYFSTSTTLIDNSVH